MFPHAHNPFDTRPPAKKGTAGFLAALGDQQAAEAFREAMGEDATSSTTDDQEQEFTPEELARLKATEDRDRERELVELRKREYLEWAQEFDLGGDDPQGWIADTFTFNPDGTVEVDGNLHLLSKSITHLPKGLTRVNGRFNLSYNRLTSLEGLSLETHGDLYLDHNQLTSLEGLSLEIHGALELAYNPLTSLEGLRGQKIDGDLYLDAIPAESIPEGIKLGGKVVVDAPQTALKQDAESKGYTVEVVV